MERLLNYIKRPRFAPHPNRKASLRGRSKVYNLLDNVIGFDDDRITAGEALGAQLRSDPIGTVGRAVKGVSDDLYNLQFEGGAAERPLDVLGYATGVMGGSALKAGKGILDYDPNTTRIFLGPKAANADLAALKRAKEMDYFEDRGEILKQTGWFKGADGNWRFEVDDRNIDLRSGEASTQMANDMLSQSKGILDDVRARKEQLKVQPDFFPEDVKKVNSAEKSRAREIRQEAESSLGPMASPDLGLGQRAQYAVTGDLQSNYPEMMRGTTVSTSKPLDRYLGSFDGKRIEVDADADARQKRSTLLHELQHAIQRQEGFARGGSLGDGRKIINDTQSEIAALNERLRNISRAKDAAAERGDVNQVISADVEYNKTMRKRMELVPTAQSEPYDIYKSLAGEVEARNVQARRNFTPEQRAAQPPWMTEDVSLEDQRVLFDRPTGASKAYSRADDLRRQANIERFGYDPNEATAPQSGGGLISDYAGDHRAPMRDGNAPAFDLAGDIYPDDIYSSKAVQYYGTGNSAMDQDTMTLLQSLRGKPDAEVTIYRAVPKGVDSLNAGDWVTVNKQYAEDHGDAALGGDFDIVERRVKAKDIFTNGDSIHEFGYDPQDDRAALKRGLLD